MRTSSIVAQLDPACAFFLRCRTFNWGKTRNEGVVGDFRRESGTRDTGVGEVRTAQLKLAQRVQSDVECDSEILQLLPSVGELV